MQSQARKLRNAAMRCVVLLGFLSFASHRAGWSAQTEKLILDTQQVHVAAGAATSLALPAASADFVRQSTKLAAETVPGGLLHLSVGKDPETGTLFVAAPPTMPPGNYSVNISGVDAAGE